MVTLRGLPFEGIVCPPKDPGPWCDAWAWLKSIAQCDMKFRRNEGVPVQEYVAGVKAIIDEPQQLNGLFLSGPLSINAPFVLDMWSFRNIKAVLDGDKVTLVALLDMEGMQVILRWALGQAPRIEDVDAELSDLLLDLLLKDPVLERTPKEGRQARHLLVLAQRATMSSPSHELIEKFRKGILEDMGA
ncbi:hypothetical protein CALVIDRAFT_592020 [Calocera viscosa TUFC12733]|uniref:Uncharacterized protein n=1 Tax=Calocera viscosa (strain TUFC12733) TaxID=1330018 RepID=A0A167G001_CALVF|nr:hypothetical protein CALVIDRAFT_592020 [Calocera viscosa TUFC12733]